MERGTKGDSRWREEWESTCRGRKTQTIQRRASSLVSNCGESRKGGSREDKPRKIGGSEDLGQDREGG